MSLALPLLELQQWCAVFQKLEGCSPLVMSLNLISREQALDSKWEGVAMDFWKERRFQSDFGKSPVGVCRVASSSLYPINHR
jgi:hypothetical protein